MVAEMTFDYADGPSTLTATPAGGSQVNIVNSAVYRPYGPISSLVLGNSRTETRDFNTRDAPAGVQVGQLNWDYTIDKVGNPTAIVDALNSANNRTYAYQDYQYFLTTGNGPWGTRSWTYDAIGNRLTETRGALTETYAYQPNAATNASPLLATITWTAGNRTFQFVTTGGTVTPRYDDSGRMDRQSLGGDVSLFSYDGRAFLPEAASQSTSASGIFCDGFEDGTTSQWGTGPGSTCVDTSVRTEPTYASEGLLHSLRNGSQSRNILYFGNRPVALQTGTQIRYLTTDHLGTPILMMDNTGATLWQGGLEPFGLDWNGAQIVGQFLRFPGQWEDAAWSASQDGIELSNNLFRWYASEAGRYTQVDPLGESHFEYGMNRPLYFTDPTGLKVELWCSQLGEGGGGLRGVAGAVGAKHCFVRARCDCTQNGAPWDLRLEVTGRSGPPLQSVPADIPQNPPRFHVANAQAIIVPMEPQDWDSMDCTLEKCVVDAYHELRAKGYQYGPIPRAWVTGPNSNTFAAELLRRCGVKTIYWPSSVPPFTLF